MVFPVWGKAVKLTADRRSSIDEMLDFVCDARGFDKENGWSCREAYEKCALKDAADELNQLGLLLIRLHVLCKNYGETSIFELC